MHSRAPSTRPWRLGAVFAFVAAALVAVFGITPAHASGTARHAAGTNAAETLTSLWTMSAPDASVTAAPADEGDEHAHGHTPAVAPAPVGPAGPTVRFAAPPVADDRTGSAAPTDTWGRAPPA